MSWFGVTIMYTFVKAGFLRSGRNKDMWEYRNNMLRRIIWPMRLESTMKKTCVFKLIIMKATIFWDVT
jgi:hypothetical protein